MEHRALTVSVYFMNMTAWCAVFLFICGSADAEINPVYAGAWIIGAYAWAVAVRAVKPGIVALLLFHMFSFSALVIQDRLIVRPENAWIVFSAVLLFGMTAGSIDRWRQGYAYISYSFKWQYIILIALIYITGIFKKDRYMRGGSLAIGIILILFHMWCTYLENLNDYFDNNADLKDQQKDDIISVTGKAARRTLIAAAVCMLFSFMITRENLIGRFVGLIGSLIRKLIFLINSIMKLPEGYGLEERPEGVYATSPPEGQYYPETDFDSRGLYIVLLIISLLIIAVFTYRQIHSVHETSVYGRMSAYKKLRHDDDESKVGAVSAGRIRFFRNNKEKIRYMFKRKVRAHFKENVPESYTAWEFDRALKDEMEDHAMDELTEVYEDARYSRHEITRQQVDSVKNALNRSRKR